MGVERGRFVVVEGNGGAGKTTQLSLLRERVLSDWVFLREPGGTDFGEAMRRAVQYHDEWQIHPTASLLAYNASRANLVLGVVRPALVEGKNIVMDRYWFSSYAIQGAEGVKKRVILAVARIATEEMMPDLVLHYDISPEVGVLRKKGCEDVDRYDKWGPEFHEKVRRNYRELRRLYPAIWRTVDGSGTIEAGYQRTLEVLQEFGMIC